MNLTDLTNAFDLFKANLKQYIDNRIAPDSQRFGGETPAEFTQSLENGVLMDYAQKEPTKRSIDNTLLFIERELLDMGGTSDYLDLTTTSVDTLFNTGEAITAIAVAGDTVVVFGDAGSVALSTDNAANFTGVASGTSGEVLSAGMVDATVLFGTDDAHIYQSADGGTTFTRVNDSEFPSGFLSATQGNRLPRNIVGYDVDNWFIATGESIVRSSSGGWVAVDDPSAGAEIFTIDYHSTEGLLAGTTDGLFVTTDWTNWTELSTGLVGPIHTVRVADDQTILAQNADGDIAIRRNGSWTTNVFATTLRAVDVSSENNWLAVTENNDLYISLDNGKNWIYLEDNAYLVRRAANGWGVVHANRTVTKSTDATP